MATTAEQMRTFEGPAILSYGFRPFFLVGAIWAALAMAIWLPMLAGSLSLPTAFAPIDWHAHELLAAAGIAFPEYIATSGALHGRTAGAIGLMTLAVMTRASLGHTGRPLTATAPTQLIYVAALLAALARIVSAFGGERDLLLHISASAWVRAGSPCR